MSTEDTKPASRGILTAIGRHELGTLLTLLGLSLGTCAFFYFAGRVMDGSMEEFDKRILLSMRTGEDLSEPAGPPWLKVMARDFTSFGGIGVLLIVTISSAILLSIQGKTSAMRLLLCAIIGGWALMVALKRGFERARPDLISHDTVALSASFPSGHSMMATITWLTLAVIIGRVESGARIKGFLICLATLLALAVGASRVYLGVHWPSDVIGGWAIGLMWATLCWVLARWLQRRGKIEPESGN